MARKMRDSGVEWIGEVPEGWEVNRLQWHLEEIVEKNDPIQTTNILSLTNDRGVIPYEDKGNVGNKAKENYTEYKLAYKNTIVANSMNVLIGSVGLSKYDGCVSPVYYIYKSKDSNSIRYYNYLFQLTPFQKELRRYANGILEIRLRVSSSDILKRSVPAPSFSEQRRIADYLDEKCAAIDGAVCELKRGIEDCKAWKKAIITEVTSVGLDDDVKLWQTELGWISNRPSYWKRNQLSSLCRRGITYGIVKLGDPCENGVKVLRCSDVKDGHLDASNVRTVTPELSDEYKRTVLSGGEVIVNVRGTLGGCAIVPKEFSGANIAREVALLDVEESKANPKFVMYTLLSSCFANYVGHEMAGAIYQGLNIATLSKYSFYAPDIKEQQAIADYLDEKCAAIDALVAEKEKLIADLETYKKSLIFELVTGKREVA